jgi:hypothetical protein
MRYEHRLNLRRVWTRGGRLVYSDSNFRPFDEIPEPAARVVPSGRDQSVLTSVYRPQAFS